MNVMHPSLYQVNTRLLLSRISKDRSRAKLLDIPQEYWKWLREIGMDYVWLMGVWNTNEIGFRVERQDWELKKYTSVLPDFTEDDLRGSPYAIDQYRLDPQMGKAKDLKVLKHRINDAGLKLILDFVPNHFGAHSSLIGKFPEVFLQGNETSMKNHPRTFFRHASGRIFAHGKDPNFDPWMDTIQVNYASQAARAFMQQVLIGISEYCDGLRCDMSMLLQKHVFQRTWGHLVDPGQMEEWDDPFWSEAIQEVKETKPDFIFIAECYWSMEQEMLDHGFDYTYDKALLDKMISGNVHEMRWHLRASADYQNRSVRFLENHDEAPVQTTMHQEQHFAASMLIAHMPGMRFYHGGQWEGKRVLVPVQLRRRPTEPNCECLLTETMDDDWKDTLLPGITDINCLCTWMHYQRLLKHTNSNILKQGKWEFIEFEPVNPDDDTHQNLFGYIWKRGRKSVTFVVNFSPVLSKGRYLDDDGGYAPISLRPFRYKIQHR